jgi:hypothetical protein
MFKRILNQIVAADILVQLRYENKDIEFLNVMLKEVKSNSENSQHRFFVQGEQNGILDTVSFEPKHVDEIKFERATPLHEEHCFILINSDTDNEKNLHEIVEDDEDVEEEGRGRRAVKRKPIGGRDKNCCSVCGKIRCICDVDF